jgi:hypothetical protein
MCLSLIDYYKLFYDNIYVIIRLDAKEFVDFYVKDKSNIEIIYIETDNGRYYGNINILNNIDKIEYINSNNINIPSNFDLLFHGEHDVYRKDKYKNYWYQSDDMKIPTSHFSESFYIYYNIDFNNRINNFNVNRDNNLEEIKYQEFIKEHGVDYILYHDDENNHTHGIHHVSTKIDIIEKNRNFKYINLNKKSKIFFDYIKILQNAKEIHLIDSIWATLYYQLDCKYNIFENKKVNIYCKRGHYNLFLKPKKLQNWILI